ncbi:hypothetical protein ACKC9G_18340 [Pokkaliibacter sp. CJK22405]|uniref:hypothetical protein n=1 Tax=Pokkaliibacter sp. CJK22405 TaxID=3384615 RepID=UPI003984BB29
MKKGSLVGLKGSATAAKGSKEVEAVKKAVAADEQQVRSVLMDPEMHRKMNVLKFTKLKDQKIRTLMIEAAKDLIAKYQRGDGNTQQAGWITPKPVPTNRAVSTSFMISNALWRQVSDLRIAGAHTSTQVLMREAIEDVVNKYDRGEGQNQVKE